MLTAWHRGRGEPAAAKETLLAYLRQSPLDEEMNAELLLLYAEAGETGPYLRHYGDYERLLADELGAKPADELRRLAERMR